MIIYSAVVVHNKAFDLPVLLRQCQCQCQSIIFSVA